MRWFHSTAPPPPTADELLDRSAASRDELAAVTQELRGFIAELKDVTARLETVTGQAANAASEGSTDDPQ